MNLFPSRVRDEANEVNGSLFTPFKASSCRRCCLDPRQSRAANQLAGAEALALAAADWPDVVLMEIGLPGMSGIEAGRRPSDLPSLDDVRIIAATGYGQGADRDATAQLGFDPHVTKPVNPEELNRLIAGAASQTVSGTA